MITRRNNLDSNTIQSRCTFLLPHTMNHALYSPSLAARLAATKQYLATPNQLDSEYYPEGLRGSANAYLVLVGPSYGAHKGTDEKQDCRTDIRPTSNWAKKIIGHGLGLNCFQDGSKARTERWNKLLLACLGTEDAVKHLSALYNLDWGHHANQSSVPKQHLQAGADVVAQYIYAAKPRIIMPLTKMVWSFLIPSLINSGSKILQQNVLKDHQSLLIRLDDKSTTTEFDTIIVRPYNHPSRHFLTQQRIDDLKAALVSHGF